VKWNFHLWVGVDSKLPAMFSSPFGGVATYGNWTIYDEEKKTGGPDELWPEWRKNPFFCLNVQHNKNCPFLEGNSTSTI